MKNGLLLTLKQLIKLGIIRFKKKKRGNKFKSKVRETEAFEKGFDAVVALGLVLKGETPHFDYVCQGVTQGVIDVQLKFSRPIGYGVLMCNDLEQAIARSGRAGSKEDKGYDSAMAALKLIEL